MSRLDELINLKITTQTKPLLISLINEYKTVLSDLIQQNKLYLDLIKNQNAIKTSEDDPKSSIKEFSDEEELELHKLIKKLKTQLELTNTNIENLKSKNAKLQILNSIQSQEIENLNKTIYELKQTSQLENLKQYINSLFTRRKFVPFVEIDTYRNGSEQLLSNNSLSDQKQIEINILDSFKSILQNLYENIDNITSDIYFEFSIIQDKLLETRDRLSLYTDQEMYLHYLNEFMNGIKPIIELLKIKNKNIEIALTPYEKLLLRSTDYIYECEKNSDIQQRLIYNHFFTDTLTPYKLVDKIQYCHMFSSIDTVILNLLITSNTINILSTESTGINNICYVPTKNCDQFLVLDSVVENISISDQKTIRIYYWNYDCYLLNTIRNITKKFLPVYIEEFKRFYKDCFKHNNYIDNFEKQLEKMNIKRWKQYKILYENIRILSDEYMTGEIIRDMIRKKCIYKDLGKLSKTSGLSISNVIRGNSIPMVISDFAEAQKYFSQGKPYIDEFEYYTDLFDNLHGFNETEFSKQYERRWKEFLKVYYK